MSVSIPSIGFDHFELDRALMSGIRAAGFASPWPIQLDTIPAGLEGRDVLGLAQTGTGKTAAFALPLLDRLLETRNKGVRAHVLAPTRELATQIATEIRTLSNCTSLKTVTVYGGVSTLRQVTALRQRPDIVVGCPGRVLDLLQQRVLRLDRVETLVIDEADHMFDMGFLPDLKKIMRHLPARRQNLLFSATMPSAIRRLADEVLTDPHVVELASAAPIDTIDHALYAVAEPHKHALLEHMLGRDECDSAIVFARTKHRAKRLAEKLKRAGHRAVALQGNMSQGQRDRAMSGFRSGQHKVLVATDIAARGIDVSGVSHVINFDVPNTPEAYTHRIGRTGRAERDGVACTFITPDDDSWVRATERMIGGAIPRRSMDGFEFTPQPGSKPSMPKREGGRSSRPRRRRSGSARRGRGRAR